MNGHVIHLAWNDLAHLAGDLTRAELALAAVHDERQRVNAVTVDEHVDLDHIGRAVLFELVVHAGITARHALELVEEVEHDLSQRHLIRQHHLSAVIGHVELHAALQVRQRHHRSHAVLRHVQMHRDDGLADLVDAALVRHLARVLDLEHRAVTEFNLIDHTGRGRDEVLVELTLQALLHDFHVQQAQETTTESKAQGLAHFGLVTQRRIVELEFFKRVTQLVVLAGFGGVQPCKNLRFDLFKTGQGFGGRARVVGQLFVQRDGVTHLGGIQLTNATDDETHLARTQRFARHRLGCEDTHLLDVVDRVGGHQANPFTLAERTIHHTHQHHHAHIVVEPAVDNHGARRATGVATGRRHAGDDGFKDFVQAHAGFGRARDGVVGVDADDFFDLFLGALGVGLRQIHLVEHGHHFNAKVERRVAVGHCLCFDPLAGVHHQERAFTSAE